VNTLYDIRPATPADVPVLLTLVEEYWKFEEIEGFDPERIGAVLRRALADERLGRAWIAHDGEAPAGYLFIVFVFSIEHGGLTAEIDEFFVAPEHRGHAVGAQLLAAAETACRAAGCTNITLQLGRENESARRFYRRKGYSERRGYELLDKDLD
jgi:GNAT superfamily N-acetyltransferase